MQVVNYRPKTLQQGDANTGYLSATFSETFEESLSFQGMPSDNAFFTKIEDHNCAFGT